MMGFFSTPHVVDALDDLLDRERQAILSGNLDTIMRQMNEKLRLLERLTASTTDIVRIERLKVKADRNQELLVAVGRGIKSATQRLKEIGKPVASLRTYDKGGVSTDMLQKKSKLERRA